MDMTLTSLMVISVLDKIQALKMGFVAASAFDREEFSHYLLFELGALWSQAHLF